jgi:DNA-binding PadR family transcriptional regulator
METPMSRAPRGIDRLLLGEWACLGVLAQGPNHGFAVAQELRVTGDIGRVWSLTRPLTYRAIDQLIDRGYLQVVGEEPGMAGGNRTIVSITRTGRAALRSWCRTPVHHLRDMRSELLLKLVVASKNDIDTSPLIVAQRVIVEDFVRANRGSRDVVSSWRREMALAAKRFLDSLD